MLRVDRLPYIAVLAAYGFVTVGHLLPGVFGSWGPRWVSRVALAGVAIHAITLVASVFAPLYPTGLPEALSATSLGIAGAYAWVTRQGRTRALGMFLAPLAMVLLGTSLVVPHHSVAALRETGFSPWLPVHLTLVFSGIAGFGLSGVVGGVYLWVRARLKQKRFVGLHRLPSLEVLDRMQFRAMLFGFVFLTLGIGAGGMWAAATLQEPWAVDPKVWFTVLIWAWYGAALQVRLVAGRRGRWTALFSIVGFAGLVFSLVGVNFLVGGFHAYGG